MTAQDLFKRGLSLLVALGVAWVVYYRETMFILDQPGVTIKDPTFFCVRWYRIGKIAQDLLLKFGGAPVILAVIGMRSGALAARPVLRSLLRSWFMVGAAFAALAVVSVFPLRFEYFLLPAVALATGVATQGRNGRAGQLLVHMALGVSLIIQSTIGWFHLQGKFQIIAVIMESPRWPFPFTW
ncbi:MAG: hypothetical protein MUF51_04405 [Vicinamibacteria bacterium]|nr:hypothetical protein [Vicinamibacteria bacterium]